VTGRRLLASILLLGLVLALGWSGYVLARAYHEFWAVERRLPQLPQIHARSTPRAMTFPDKVWLHRVNSVERAVLMATKYKGLEIDVVYDSAGAYFDVGHPPVPTVGLSLDRLLGAVPNITDHYFWIDFKNLTETNASVGFRVLLTLAHQHGILGHLIVESPNLRALSRFTASGFYTSYYLFPDSSLLEMDTEQIARYYQQVKANLAASNVNALSSDFRSLPFIERYFPDGDILLWHLETKGRLRYYAGLAYLKRRSRVKDLLVAQDSPGYR